VLGLLAGASYTESRGRLAPGDCLLLYTDGINEAESPEGEEYDLPRLRDLLLRGAGQPGRAILDSIEKEIEQWKAALLRQTTGHIFPDAPQIKRGSV